MTPQDAIYSSFAHVLRRWRCFLKLHAVTRPKTSIGFNYNYWCIKRRQSADNKPANFQI
jgi:hypothetical protein